MNLSGEELSTAAIVDAPDALPTIVCVTPARNEAWIIERFLRAAESWADHIVLADQDSTDQTAAIARQFAKVEVIANPGQAYDEGKRQQILLSAARQLPGPRVIVALDADEFLTPTWKKSTEWREALSSCPGTVLTFDWVNVLPDARRAWIPAQKFAYAFVDDGSEHAGTQIHSARIPLPSDTPVLTLSEVKVIHLQYMDWARMKSKQRWYQCWERVHSKTKRPIQIYRQYHHMDAFPPDEITAIDPDWLDAYRTLGVNLQLSESDGPFWWDEQVLDWLTSYGSRTFARIDLWDQDWTAMAAKLHRCSAPALLQDPRSAAERRIHAWLRRTQPRADSPVTRWCQRALIPFGW